MPTLPTPSQTIGPFFTVALASPGPGLVADEGPVLQGHLLDGEGRPVDDALVEVSDPVSGGWARCHTDDAGQFAFVVPDGPYLSVSVFARGLLGRLVTRCYLPAARGPSPADAVRIDAVLDAVAPERRATLLAVPSDRGWTFDIHLQGHQETVFFAV